MNTLRLKSKATALMLAAPLLLASAEGSAYTLWSTAETYLGSGIFHGPGVNTDNGPLFTTIIRNMGFVNSVDFVTPFVNNGAAEPNICGENEMNSAVDGKLSDGTLINENVEICSAMVAGTRMFVAVIDDGPYDGQQLTVTLNEGGVVMSFDLGIDIGIGPKGISKVPFFGTTAELTVPYSLQTLAGKKGVDQAGVYPSGTKLRGRLGDFNHDGWIDGTILAAGNMPLDSAFYPGQPYIIERHFETDIPVDGEVAANIKALQSATRGRE